MSDAAVAHPSNLAHHFESYDQQRESASLGMWLFVAQEVMFFGGIFTAYLINRLKHPGAFKVASSELDIWLGGINTAVLIISSFTMAMAVRESQLARGKRCAGFLIATILLGLTFVGIKAVEYNDKFVHHHVPGAHFHFEVTPEMVAKAHAGPDEIARGAEAFFSIYFAMTGLHALHMIIGVVVVSLLVLPAIRGRFNAEYHNPVECTGLYWHFVDIVWIFLFPLLYLLGRH